MDIIITSNLMKIVTLTYLIPFIFPESNLCLTNMKLRYADNPFGTYCIPYLISK